MGEAITEPQLRSRDAVETEAQTGLGASGWGGGGQGDWGERGSPPGTKRCSTRFSQSAAAWQYQPFHQPLNASPCLLANTLSECERSRFFFKKKVGWRQDQAEEAKSRSDELETPIVLLLSLFIYKLFISIFGVKISMSLNKISDWLLGCDGPVYAC